MGRRKKSILWKENKKVNRYIRKWNKTLCEDCFAGRFVMEKIKVEQVSLNNGLGFPRWRLNLYTVRVKDNEQPERSCDYFVRWSEDFGLTGAVPVDYDKGTEYIGGGTKQLVEVMNNFIVKSDFWKRWVDPEYKKTHWYSGEQLKRYEVLSKYNLD